MSVTPSDLPRHLFDEPPTRAELSALLPAPRADQLSYTARDDVFEVAIVPRPIWNFLPGLVWFGLVVAIAPFTAPLWGGAFMGWSKWFALVLATWVFILPMVLVLLSWFMQREHAGEAVLLVDPVAGAAALPNQGRSFGAEQLLQVVEIIRWAEDRRHWRPVVQTSLVVAGDRGGFEVVPLVTQVRPSRFAMPLADRLSHVFEVPLVRVRLDSVQSREA
jgi:hypothetical protein